MNKTPRISHASVKNHSYGAINESKTRDEEEACSLLTGSRSQDLLHSRLNRERTLSERSEVSEHSLEVDTSLVGTRDDDEETIIEGHATIKNEIANIAKNLIGGGVLSLSGGISLYADSPKAVIPAAFWIIALAFLLGYFALVIAKICSFTKASTYRECWQRSIGERGALAVSIANLLNPAMGDLAYAAILSQTFQSLFQTIGLHVTRIQSLLLITICVLLPLCLLKNLYVLAPFSVFGTAGMLFTASAMVLRCIDGSYQIGGKYYDDIAPEYRPYFGTRNDSVSFQILPLVCMLFQAYIMHYNCPRFYTELKDASVPRFAEVLGGSFGLSAILYIVIAAAGYLTFGGHSNSYILNNYSPYDPLATACRLAVAFSTLLTFPLAFIGFRDGVLDCLQLAPDQQSTATLNSLTIALLSLITLIACFVTDLGVINAITGGFLATAMVFVFPTFMYRHTVMTASSDWDPSIKRGRQNEVHFAMVLGSFGVIVGLIGAYISLQ